MLPPEDPSDRLEPRRLTGGDPGWFIAFEGGDGSGKTTQVGLLAGRLRASGYEVVMTREPGGSGLGRQLRDILLHGDDVPPRAEALLFAADRADHAARVIRPALATGAVVITDRYIDSSVAYQGAGRCLGVPQIRDLSVWATEGLTADLTVLLDVPMELARGRRTADPDRMEAADEAFHARVREAFQALAAEAPQRYLVVEAGDPVASVAEVIARRVELLLGTRPGRRRSERPPPGHATERDGPLP